MGKREAKFNRSFIAKKYLEEATSDIYVGNSEIKTVSGKPLRIFIGEPYKKKMKHYNYIYMKLIFLLEENTNRIMADKGLPANDDYLKLYINKRGIGYSVIMEKMVRDGLLIQANCKSTQFYILNPYFAVCGDFIHTFCFDMFTPHTGKIIGSDLYNKIFKDLRKMDSVKKRIEKNGEEH